MRILYNEELPKAEPANPESVSLWTDYLSKWTTWNHVRAIASLIAASLIMALCRIGDLGY